jgi:hypothetical protein
MKVKVRPQYFITGICALGLYAPQLEIMSGLPLLTRNKPAFPANTRSVAL